MIGLVSDFINDESGASSLEYSLLVAGIALAAIFAVNGVGASFAATLLEGSAALQQGPTVLQVRSGAGGCINEVLCVPN